MDNVFKSLSDETRRKILKLLVNGDMTFTEIAENFSISKPAISKHLQILQSAQLIVKERKGMIVIYSLNTTILQNTLCVFLDFFVERPQKSSRGDCDNENEDL